jgi:hypothetical protein
LHASRIATAAKANARPSTPAAQPRVARAQNPTRRHARSSLGAARGPPPERRSANGPILAWIFGDRLLGANNPTVDFGRRDTVANGKIAAADLVGPLAGKSLDDLMALLSSGNAYVNLHTRAFPGGELRAQIVADVDD